MRGVGGQDLTWSAWRCAHRPLYATTEEIMVFQGMTIRGDEVMCLSEGVIVKLQRPPGAPMGETYDNLP